MQDKNNTVELQAEILLNGLQEDFQKSSIEGRIEQLERRLIDPMGTYEKPDPIITIFGKPFGTRGNISTLTAKPKVGKSMVCALISATVLRSGCVEHFESRHQGSKVLYFDTEQGSFHAFLQAKRIVKLSGNQQNLRYFALRTEDDERKRLEFIKDAIEYYPKTSLIILDGVADVTTTGVNDEEQSKVIVNKLMKWSAESNVHIVCILHQNKGNDSAKGHLGSHLLQKSETVLSLDKDYDTGIVRAEPTHTRGVPFEPFFMSIDETGTPYLTGEPAPKHDGAKSKQPHTYSLQENYTIISECLKDVDGLKRKELEEKIIYHLGEKDISISAQTCRNWFTYFKEKKMMFQEKKLAPYKLNFKWKNPSG